MTKKIIITAMLGASLLAFNSQTANAAFVVKQATEQVATTTNSNVEQATAINSATTKAPATTKLYGGGGKSKSTAYILGIFLGFFGAHSFYMGKTVKGVIQLALGLLGIGLIIGGFVTAVSTVTSTTEPSDAFLGGIGALVLVGYALLVAQSIWLTIDLIRIWMGGLEPESGWDS